ncbi:amidohydrolase family protein [Caulobacter segnis]
MDRRRHAGHSSGRAANRSAHVPAQFVAHLKLAGITRDTPDPPGGVIVRDANGEPTGVVKDNAKGLGRARHPGR